MQYYVIGPDGNRYGPADVPTLKLWVSENRLTPQTMLEDVSTAQRMPASAVDGLFPPLQFQQQMGPAPGSIPYQENPYGQQPGSSYPGQPAPGQPTAAQYPVQSEMFGSQYEHPPVPGQYPRQGMYYDDSSTDLTWSFVLLCLGVFICFLSPITCSFGIVQANKAIAKGNRSGQVAKIMNIVVLCLGCLVDLFYLIMIIAAMSGGFN
jgi:hypothetical protein